MRNYLILIFLLSVLSYSCDEKEPTIDSVKVYFIAKGISMPSVNHCEMVAPEYNSYVFEKNLKDIAFLKSLQRHLKNLNPSEKNNSRQDSRIRAIVNYKDGRKDILCLGEISETALNGESMIDSPELFKLIKDAIKYETTHRTLEEVLGNGKKKNPN